MLMKIHIYINSDKRKTTDKRMYSTLAAGLHFAMKRGETTYVHTDMQENMWARLCDSRPAARLIHAT